MTFSYAPTAAKAKTVIENYGRTVSLVRRVRTAADNTKPWRGPTDPGDNVIGTVKAVVFPIEDSDEKDSLIRFGTQQALISHDSLPSPEALFDIDVIVDGSTRWKVNKAVTIGPGDTIICYQFYME